MEFESQAHKVQLRRDLQCMHRGRCCVSVHVCVGFIVSKGSDGKQRSKALPFRYV